MDSWDRGLAIKTEEQQKAGGEMFPGMELGASVVTTARGEDALPGMGHQGPG